MSVAKASSLLPSFRAAISRGDFSAAQTQLGDLKLLMTSFPSAVAAVAPDASECAAARAILENALILGVRSGDWRGFERALGQLEPYYSRAWRGQEDADAASSRALATGLRLMHLLVQAQLSECAD